MSAGIVASQTQGSRVLPIDRPQSLGVIEALKDETAAVVVEAVQNANPGRHPVEFLK